MIEYEIRGHVAILTINRPEARNAVNGEVANGLEAAIDRLEADDDVWLGILCGNGPVFCAGADLKAINEGRGGELQTQRGGFAGIAQRERVKPIIAAVDGPALAGGTEIVLACDLLVASTEARFGIPEAKRSLVAAGGGLFRLPKKLPPNIAMELALTGDPIDAERAYHFGLVNELCEPGTALDTALALAARIEANSPLAVRESRRLLLKYEELDVDEGIRQSNQAIMDLASTADFSEGLMAFIEKRPPNWQGK
jgi:enoyl-CoA hydratase